MYRISLLCVVLSILTTIWLGFELGAFSYPDAIAQDAPTGGAAETAQNTEPKEPAVDPLKAQREELAAKEAALQEQVQHYEKAIQQLKAEKDQEIAALKAKIAQMEKHEAGEPSALSQIYEKMDPKRAAKILDELETNMSTHLLQSMKQDRAAEVLAKMSPEKAKRITEKFLTTRSLAKVNEVKEPQAQ